MDCEPEPEGLRRICAYSLVARPTYGKEIVLFED